MRFNERDERAKNVERQHVIRNFYKVGKWVLDVNIPILIEMEGER
jgi:hypothetical protein